MDPIAALVHCCPGLRPVDISIINGRIVVMDGQLTTIDLKVTIIHSYLNPMLACQHQQIKKIVHVFDAWESDTKVFAVALICTNNFKAQAFLHYL